MFFVINYITKKGILSDMKTNIAKIFGSFRTLNPELRGIPTSMPRPGTEAHKIYLAAHPELTGIPTSMPRPGTEAHKIYLAAHPELTGIPTSMPRPGTEAHKIYLAAHPEIGNNPNPIKESKYDIYLSNFFSPITKTIKNENQIDGFPPTKHI
jgi:hypothetical protein